VVLVQEGNDIADGDDDAKMREEEDIVFDPMEASSTHDPNEVSACVEHPAARVAKGNGRSDDVIPLIPAFRLHGEDAQGIADSEDRRVNLRHRSSHPHWLSVECPFHAHHCEVRELLLVILGDEILLVVRLNNVLGDVFLHHMLGRSHAVFVDDDPGPEAVVRHDEDSRGQCSSVGVRWINRRASQ